MIFCVLGSTQTGTAAAVAPGATPTTTLLLFGVVKEIFLLLVCSCVVWLVLLSLCRKIVCVASNSYQIFRHAIVTM